MIALVSMIKRALIRAFSNEAKKLKCDSPCHSLYGNKKRGKFPSLKEIYFVGFYELKKYYYFDQRIGISSFCM
jgi:hypothetical protein